MSWIRNTGRNFFVKCVPDPDSQRCQMGPSSRPLSRNVAVLKVGRPWIISGRESALNCCDVVGKIYHFIFKALIFWEKVKVSLAFENW
jgi:hypothetical protein